MDYTRWASAVSESVAQIIQRIIGYLPNVISALALVAAGWLLARVLRAFSARLVTLGLQRAARNAAIHRSIERSSLRQTIPKVISGIFYWVVFLFFVAAAIEQLQLTAVTVMLTSFAQYLPRVLLGASLVFLGLIAGHLVHHWVASAAASAGISYSILLGRIAQVVTVLVAIVIAADQVGIQSGFFTLTVAILAGSTLGGMALAFGLGSGATVSNIIASYYLNKTYKMGQKIRIGEVQGKILEISPTAVILETPDGRVLIPAKKFTEETSVLLTGGR